MAKQDFETRQLRLSSGGCPIHGIGVTQTGHWYAREDGTSFAIFSCPRGDCDITLRGNPSTNFWEATPETAPLLGLAPAAEKVYDLDDLFLAFGRIETRLALRAYQFALASGCTPQDVIETALTKYLDSQPPALP